MRTLPPLTIVYLVLVVASYAEDSDRSRSFEGVTATFRITTPIIKPGDKLKVVTVYHNTGVTTVLFPFMDPSHFSEIFRKGERNHVTGYYIGTPFVQEVTLKPLESVEFEEEVSLEAFEHLSSGEYEIQFCFHLGMLPEAIQEKYLKKYPHDGLVVPWSDQRYQFTLAK